MTITLVKRYTCDHCGKRQYSASHMRRHEKRCTKNPERECRVCKLMENTQPDLKALMAILPDGNEFLEAYKPEVTPGGSIYSDSYGSLASAVNALLPELGKAAGECPACMMAAMRQRHIPIPIVTGFDYQGEMKAVWDDFNESQREWSGV